MTDPLIEAVRKFALSSEGGVYRWKDLFRLFEASWASSVFPWLELGGADPAVLRDIAQRFSDGLDQVVARWHQEGDEMRFHRESAYLLETTYDALEARLGPKIAENVVACGVITNTGGPFLWVTLLRRLQTESADIASLAIKVGITPTELGQLVRLVEELNRSLQSVEDASPNDDHIRDQALDLVRAIQVGRLFGQLAAEWRCESLYSLLEWGRREADQLGADPTVLDITEEWLC